MSAPTLFLYGTYELSFDDKSRVVLPAAFRKLLSEECGGQLVLTQSLFDPCLWLYPQPMWDNLLSDLNAASTISHPALQSMQRLLLSAACAVKIDAQGRLAVSSVLRSLSGMDDKKIFLLGLQHKFELWAPAALTQRQEQDRQAVRAAFAKPADSGILGQLRF